MSLTAIVCCKDRSENLQYCVHSILGGNLVPKIIVVDFGSSVAPVLPTSSHLRIITVSQGTDLFHKARALNIGLKNSETEYVCITDADQIFAPDFFAQVLRLLTETTKSIVFSKTYFLLPSNTSVSAVLDPSVGVYTTHPLVDMGITPPDVPANYKKILSAAQAQKIKPRGYGCCHGISRSWLMQVHGYDEEYIGWGAEDRDLEVRALAAGFIPVWANSYSTMIHLPHKKTGEYYNDTRVERNMARYTARRNQIDKVDIVVNKDTVWGELTC